MAASHALQDLRALLQSSLRSPEAADVFTQLFSSFAHSCAASLALALLAQARGGCRSWWVAQPAGLTQHASTARTSFQGTQASVHMLPLPAACCHLQAYGLACELLAVCAQEPLSMRPETAVELSQVGMGGASAARAGCIQRRAPLLCNRRQVRTRNPLPSYVLSCLLPQLVSLLEAPAFAPLRLQLLQPAQHPALLRAVHGLLMLLPQGDAFRLLQARLQPVPLMALLSLREQQQQPPSAGGASAALAAAALGGQALPAGSPAGSPGGGSRSGSFAGLDAGSVDQPTSPTSRQRQQIPARPRLIEERQLVALFRSRQVHRLAG